MEKNGMVSIKLAFLWLLHVDDDDDDDGDVDGDIDNRLYFLLTYVRGSDIVIVLLLDCSFIVL